MLLFCLLLLFSVIYTQKYDVVGDIIQTKNGFKGTMKVSSDIFGRRGNVPDIIEFLDFQFFYETENRVHLRITDSNDTRWEVPDVIVSETPSVSPSTMNYNVFFTNSPFSFKIVRTSDNYPVFNTNGFEFYYDDQFLEISTGLMSTNPHIYGIGERKHNFRLDPSDKTYVMFNKDQLTPLNLNLYGTYPFYLEVLNSTGNAHGVFFLNSNAQEININGPGQSLRYRTIGGILDIFFFLGPSPKDVVKQYLEVVGNPYFVPYWALGYHQSRYGLSSLKLTEDVVSQFQDNNIPLETMWNDIDFMDQYKDWTVDPVNYPMSEYQNFLEKMHSNNMHYIQIFDCGIKNETGYSPYDEGEKNNIFIKENNGIHDLIGQVWPGYSAFPDWWNTDAQTWFSAQLKAWYDQLPLDGLWIDMNEPSSFCNGECNGKIEGGVNGFDPMNPPYVPGGVDLSEKTLRMDGRTNLSILYDVHNLYGFQEAVLTNQFLADYYDERPFVLTRSSFAGVQRYASKWTGDNSATYDDLFYSISGCLSMSMFGVSTCGADICGFMGDTTAELCGRWMQLGSFYSFMRNHNSKGCIDQYPYSLGEQVLKTSIESIHNRYQLLPYLYTLLWKAHEGGDTVMRPLFFEFWDDSGYLPFIDRQFMWGDALMISPVLSQGKTTVSMYVPDSKWYDYFTYVSLVPNTCPSTMEFCTVPADIDTINVHIRGGKIVPRKIENEEMTITDLRKNQPFEIMVALDESCNAEGEIYVDDGKSLQAYENGKYTQVKFEASPSSSTSAEYVVKGKVVKVGYSGPEENMVLDSIRVLGVNFTVSQVTVQGESYADWMYLTNDQVLLIQGMKVSLLSDFTVVYR